MPGIVLSSAARPAYGRLIVDNLRLPAVVVSETPAATAERKDLLLIGRIIVDSRPPGTGAIEVNAVIDRAAQIDRRPPHPVVVPLMDDDRSVTVFAR